MERRRRKAERPTEILDAAFEAFSTTGYAGTRVEDIARRAGVTKGTIYVYYPSKEDLFVATLTEIMRPALDHIASLTQAPRGPALEILRAQLLFTADRMVSDRRGREVLRMLMAEGGRFPQIVDRWYAEFATPFCAAIAAVVTYGVGRGEFRSTTSLNFPHVLIAPIIMANTWLVMFGDRQLFDVAGFFESTLDVLAHGLLVPASGQSLVRE